MATNNRNLVFISHANPEESEFTRWLGLQLTQQGYWVWSDITKLIGGEQFWQDIEDAIRNYTVKFLFVSSKTSNGPNRNTRKELQVADTVAKTNGFKDFIIPVRVDDISHNEINILIHGLNVIDFTDSWASGLAKVLAKLDKDNVPKDTGRYNPAIVCSWWKNHLDGMDILQNEMEQYLSNWFPIINFPQKIYIHRFMGKRQLFTRGVNEFPFPAFPIRDCLVSFANAEDLKITNSETICVEKDIFLKKNDSSIPVSAIEMHNAIIYILRIAWMSYMEFLGLPTHQLAGERKCIYFTGDMVNHKMVSFDISDFLSGRRSLVGKFYGKSWHFGISADVQIEPIMAYIIRSHVIFSDDGKTIWDSNARLHSVRRTACKNWWNAHWRDRILAAMFWLAQKQNEREINIPISSKSNIKVSLEPVIFESSVKYNDNLVTHNPFVDEKRLEDEIEFMLDVEEGKV